MNAHDTETAPAITEDNYFDACVALHYYATENHGGQFSDLYSILCQIDYTPGCSERDCPDESREMYAALESGEIDAGALWEQIAAFRASEGK